MRRNSLASITAKNISTTVERLIAALGLRSVRSASSRTSGVARRLQDSKRCSRLPPPIAINQCTAAFFRPAPINHKNRASAENRETCHRDSWDKATMKGSARWLRRESARSRTAWSSAWGCAENGDMNNIMTSPQNTMTNRMPIIVTDSASGLAGSISGAKNRPSVGCLRLQRMKCLTQRAERLASGS